MTAVKTSLSLPTFDKWKPIEKKSDNNKLNHLYSLAKRVHDEFKTTAPNQAFVTTKYDMVAANVTEALLLMAYRERQNKKMDEYAKKLKKMMSKF